MSSGYGKKVQDMGDAMAGVECDAFNKTQRIQEDWDWRASVMPCSFLWKALRFHSKTILDRYGIQCYTFKYKLIFGGAYADSAVGVVERT